MAQQTFSGVPGDFSAGQVLTAADMDKLREFLLYLIKDGDEGDTGEVSPLILDLGNDRVGINTAAPVLTGLTIGRQPAHTHEGGQINYEGGTNYTDNLSWDRYADDLRLLFDATWVGTWSSAGKVTATSATISTGNFVVTAGTINSPGTVLNTTAAAANMHISAGGWFYMYSSSRRYKTDIEDLEDAYADKVLDMRPVWYRSTCDDDRKDHSHWGFIAEEVDEIDPRLVTYGTIPILDDDGKPTFEQVPVLDSDGNPTFEQIEGVDDDGNPTFTDGDQRYEAGDQLVERDADGEPITRPDAVEYTKIIPLLVNLIKRQDARIAALEAAV
jgi:hypothetical protein